MFASLVGYSSAALASEGLCAKIRTFETAPAATTDNLKDRRWVEFHWGFDKDALWSWGCRHSVHQVSGETCSWLAGHTNQEFAMILPQSIMECYGYRLPKFASYDWNDIVGTIKLRGAGERRLILELNYRDLPNGEVAMRLAVEGSGVEYEPDQLPSILPMPPQVQK
jgi:hypothetical protein